jgi:MtfA peptidase
VLGFLRGRRRRRLRAQPVPPAWRATIESRFALYRGLSPEDREKLLAHVHVFLAEKKFEGCAGLEVTDEIRVTVAAQACLLLLRQADPTYYPNCDVILVYPHAYVARQTQLLPGGIVVEGDSARLGESWTRGVVVLSWDDVREGASDARDGHNVVLHEFAHQLDQEDGSSDGAPVLERRSQYVAWARILSAEYAELQRAAETGRRTDIDTYGATNAAEFFAVATEAFFERPGTLRKKHPELYDELRMFYRQDPAAERGHPSAAKD